MDIGTLTVKVVASDIDGQKLGDEIATAIASALSNVTIKLDPEGVYRVAKRGEQQAARK